MWVYSCIKKKRCKGTIFRKFLVIRSFERRHSARREYYKECPSSILFKNIFSLLANVCTYIFLNLCLKTKIASCESLVFSIQMLIQAIRVCFLSVCSNLIYMLYFPLHIYGSSIATLDVYREFISPFLSDIGQSIS